MLRFLLLLLSSPLLISAHLAAAKEPVRVAPGKVEQVSAPEAGVNITSASNSYDDALFQGAALDGFLSSLKERGITRISLRVTWATIEREEGTLNPRILANLKRIYGKAHTYGFKAMLDFHTLFMLDNYACPEWVAQHKQDDGSPCVRSIAMIARSESVRKRYLACIAGVVSELKDCQAIDVVSLMNEPFSLEWQNPVRWKADLEKIHGVMEAAAGIVREKAPGRRVAVRFSGAVNPWSQNPARRFDAERLLRALDIIGQNVYIDPNNDEARHMDKLSKDPHPTLTWGIVGDAAETCRKAGKALWITEFGAEWKDAEGKPDLEQQKKWFEGFCKRFFGGGGASAIGPQAIMAWVLQPNLKKDDKYGLYDEAAGGFRPAFEVYAKYARGRR